MTLRSVTPLLALLSSLLACGDRASRDAGRIEDSSAGTVSLGLGTRQPYRAVAVGTPASLAGTVLVRGQLNDSIVGTGVDPRTCGDSATVREVLARDSSLANALVWVDGITSGKPLPTLRRATLTFERCRVLPRVLAVTAGTTVNVFANDPVAHDVRFYRESRGEPVARVQTFDAGQVVPSETIADESGIVEARCTRHPWVRGYIAVFEHPYFALTDERGAFIIEGLPAGSHTVKVWHEGLEQPLVRQVTIGAGGSGRLNVTLALR
ncbi:MAG: carboxypeptidase regulatory-like domain-containing protein [Gemmatimonadaceae bacterium]